MGAERLLEEADDRLRRRDYAGCRSCAVLALQLDPRIVGAEQVIAICDVFLALESNGLESTVGSPNWYSVLKLEPFTEDDDLIVEQFKNMITLLTPSRNSYSHAGDAYRLVREAFRVLSSEEKKMKFDEELRKKFLGVVEEEEEDKVEDMEEVEDMKESFFTMCPFCYWIFEYERVHVDCCLRCQNCRRGFHGVDIQWPPPMEAGKDGKTSFVMFMPFGVHMEESKKGGGFGNGSGVKWVEISDDDDDELKHEPAGPSGKGAAVGELQHVGGVEGAGQGSGSITKSNGRGGRRKTVATNTKKVMGRGIPRSGLEQKVQDSTYRNVVDEDGGIYGGGKLASSGGAVDCGVDFMDGDDDLMVCVEDL